MFKSYKRSILSGLVAVFGMAFIAHASAQTVNLRYAQGNPPHAASVIAAERYTELADEYSDGTLKVRVFPGTLLQSEEISSGVSDGTVDIGLVFTSYAPSEFPELSMAADLSMLATQEADNWRTGLLAFPAALMEYVFFNCPDCLAEFKKHNQVYVGGFTSTPYGLACSKPVNSVDSIKGKSIRTVGASWARWANYVGASSTNMPSSEMLQALAQGVVDCVAISLVDLEAWGLYDVTKAYTTGVPGGAFTQVAGSNVNTDTWARLTAEQRQALMRASAAQSAGATSIYIAQEEEVIDRITNDDGVQFLQPDQDLLDLTADFIAEDQVAIAEFYHSNFGVENGEEKISTMVELLDKWLDIMDGVDSREEVEQIYWDNIFSKLDPESYGM